MPGSYGGDSFFGNSHPAAAAELVSSLPAITAALVRGKVTPMGALKPHNLAERPPAGPVIYEKVESREERYELNLYVTGYDEDNEETVSA